MLIKETKMYKKVDTSLNFLDREKEVLDFWKENEIFEKSLEQTKDGDEFCFYDGPPTANGKPHIGHVLTRVMKDIIPRYKTMKGMHVARKAGWDWHLRGRPGYHQRAGGRKGPPRHRILRASKSERRGAG